MSRPKRNNKKSHTVKIRMTDEEVRKLAEYAEQHKITMSDTIRRALSIVYYFDPVYQAGMELIDTKTGAVLSERETYDYISQHPEVFA